MKKRYEIMAYIFLLVMIVIGGVLGLYIAEGEFNFSYAAAAVKGTVGGGIITFIFSKLLKKKNKVPKFDERSLLIMKRYLLIVLYFVLFGSGAILIALYGMGVHTIETGMLIVYMMILYIVIGIGVVVVKQI